MRPSGEAIGREETGAPAQNGHANAEHYGQQTEISSGCPGYVDDKLKAVFPKVRTNALHLSAVFHDHQKNCWAMVSWSTLDHDDANTSFKLEDRSRGVELGTLREYTLLDVWPWYGSGRGFAYCGG